MDFLDSLDLQPHAHDKKTDRMRSWYLYEQYRTLEQHQLDAAQQLRNRSVQEQLLHQELTERRARRSLFDQLKNRSVQEQLHQELTKRRARRSLLDQVPIRELYRTLEQHQQRIWNRLVQQRLQHQELTERHFRRSRHDQVSVYLSDPKQDRSQATCLSTTNDDFYESFCELHDFEDNNSLGSHHGSDNTFMEDKNLEDFHEDTSCADSVSSVVDKEATDKSAQRTIAENIKLHLQTVKENMASLERYARMADGDHISEASVDSLGWPKRNVLRKNVDDNQLFYMWSRLVAFAYHIIQLNHGNCYYDYSSQLLTAVLACDALRRGINRMCDILQYYVSPVKYASDSEDHSTICSKKLKKKLKKSGSKKLWKSSKYKINSSSQQKVTRRFEDDHHAEHSGSSWHHYRKYSVLHTMEQNRKHRQPRRRECRRAKRSIPRTLWPAELETTVSRNFERANPMLMLVRYLDDVLKTDHRDFE